MVSPHEQSHYWDPADADMPPSELLANDILAGAAERPLDDAMAKVMAEPMLEGRIGPSGQAVMSREDRQAAGYEAYEEATRLRTANGDELNNEIVGLYRKAAHDLLTAEVWYGTGERPRDPFNMLVRAECLGWQAEGTPPGVFYSDSGHRHEDVKSVLQELADKELEGANQLLDARVSNETTEELVVQMAKLDMEEEAVAAVEAADEAGTGEHTGLEHETKEHLVAGGREALARYTLENALDSRHGGKFTAIRAHKEIDVALAK